MRVQNTRAPSRLGDWRARLRTEKRSSAGPLRNIVEVRVVKFGRGHAQNCLLECGHTVVHLSRYDLKAGSRTGCPECD